MAKKKFKIKKKHVFLFLIIALIIITTLGITMSRYIYNGLRNFYLSTKKFYFNSDKLDASTANYQLDNWSGVDPYTIIINMNSNKNSLVSAEMDIPYNITFSCSNTVSCQSTKNSGIIRNAGDHTDSFIITITPTTIFSDGDQVTINVSAESTAPYIKTLSAKFILKVGKIGLSYTIDDTANSPYFEMHITNTIDYYTVRTAFGSHTVGERLDISTYMALSDAEKANCASVIITLGFNPSVALLDMTNPSYLRKTGETTTTIGGYDYINGYSFKLDAVSSETVKFYKLTPANNYTYPSGNNPSIVSFSYQ